ncbi:MFS general substrate transporter [Trichoderma sp. SZMC 28015]
MLCSMGFVTSITTSIITAASDELMEEFDVSLTVSFLPLSLYVIALGFGPILGGPLSESLGRYPVYATILPLGTLFTLGCGFVHNFGGLCFLRFMTGFSWGPSLALASGSISETFPPKTRGPASALFILTPFLGPGLGPVIGSFVANRKGWRWTQWTMIFFAIFTMILVLFTDETYHAKIKQRISREKGTESSPSAPFSTRLRLFIQVSLIRPVMMLFTDPIITFLCLYVAVNFGIEFSFFAAVPYVFGTVYHFGVEETGLVFLSIVIGCILGFITIIVCDIFIYQKKISSYPPHMVPPEHRLYPAMIGSIGGPIGLFWFAWTAREDISWASPAAAIIPFAWGNLCIFVAALQYIGDTYAGNVVASGAAANSLARYGLAAGFPLFAVPSNLIGFLGVALLPIPFILFQYGPMIRAKSRFETIQY